MAERLVEAADALGAVREKIRALQAEETVLRATLLATEAQRVEGHAFTASVRLQVSQRLDPARLPAQIRDDPRYYKTCTARIVSVQRRKEGGGDPADLQGHPIPQEEEVDLFEPL